MLIAEGMGLWGQQALTQLVAQPLSLVLSSHFSHSSHEYSSQHLEFEAESRPCSNLARACDCLHQGRLKNHNLLVEAAVAWGGHKVADHACHK